jgi:hypothetical protein
MNIETLQRATAIQERIKFVREQIKHAEYTQGGAVPRQMGCGFNGLPKNESMFIPRNPLARGRETRFGRIPTGIEPA